MLAHQIAGYNDAVKDYERQLSNADDRIEAAKKILDAEVESSKDDLAGTKRSLAADETLAARLAESWDSQSSE